MTTAEHYDVLQAELATVRKRIELRALSVPDTEPEGQSALEYLLNYLDSRIERAKRRCAEEQAVNPFYAGAARVP